LVNEEAKEFYQTKGDEFEFENLNYVHTQKESANVLNYLEPCIIISSAGMLEGGRIQDHLYQNIQNYYCTILFIGYCAKGTLGDRLLRGDPIVRLRNRDLMVYASIKKTDLLSGHTDHNGLMETVKQQNATQLKKVFLVHGDFTSMQALATDLTTEGYIVETPSKGDVYELN
jgi:metallo-beta-lactamase family protein